MSDPQDPQGPDAVPPGRDQPDDGEWRLAAPRGAGGLDDLKAMFAKGWAVFLRYFLASGSVLADLFASAGRLVRAGFAESGRAMSAGVSGLLNWRPGRGGRQPLTLSRAAIWAG